MFVGALRGLAFSCEQGSEVHPVKSRLLESERWQAGRGRCPFRLFLDAVGIMRGSHSGFWLPGGRA